MTETWASAAWLNPVPEAYWGHTQSIGLIRRALGEKLRPLHLGRNGDQIGEVIDRLNEKTIGSVPVYATEGVGELTFGGAFLKILEEMMV